MRKYYRQKKAEINTNYLFQKIAAFIKQQELFLGEKM